MTLHAPERLTTARPYLRDTDCPLTGCNDRYVGTRAQGLEYLERHLRVWHGLPLGEVLNLMVNA